MNCSTAPRRARSWTWAAARGCSCSAGPSGSATAGWSASTSRRSRSSPAGPSATAPNLEYRVMDAQDLPFAADEFELASAIEVLEHVPDPEHTLAEMARCAERHLLVSVPREPLWRMLNMARGAYWPALGNTPGHLNHWSRRSFTRAALALRGGGRDPLAVSLDDAACPPLGRPRGRRAPSRPAPTAAARAMLSIGIASTGLLTLAYFSISSHVLERSLRDARSTLLWSVMFVIISVIYRPIEQLLSRTIAERRARGHAEHPLRVPMLIQACFALPFLVVALALHERARRPRLRPLRSALRRPRRGHARLRRQLLRARLARRARVLRAVRRARADGVALAPVLRARGGGRHRQRPDRGRARDRRGAARLARRRARRLRAARQERRARRSPPPPARAHHADAALGAPITADEADAALAGPGTEGVQEAAAHDELSLRRGGGFAGWVSGIMLVRADAAERRGADGGGDLPQQGARRDRLRRAADRARAAAALPGDPDLAAAPPQRASRRPRGTTRSRARSA